MEVMEATDYIVFDYSEREPPGLLRALSRNARALVTSLAWSASSCREGLSQVAIVRLRSALIRMHTPLIRMRAASASLRSVFVFRRPAARGLIVRRPVAAVAGVLAALVLVFVPTSAVQQLAYYTEDANAEFVSGAGPIETDDAIPVDFVGYAADDATGASADVLVSDFAGYAVGDFAGYAAGDSAGYAAGDFAGDSVIAAPILSDYAAALPARPAAASCDQLDEAAAIAHLSVDRTENTSHTAPSPASSGAYIWPADGTLTSRYGYRSTSVGSSNHKGIDISGMYGDPIYAAADGEVIVSGWSNSFGYVIHIQHDNGDVTLYSHCSSLLVSVGERVDQGQSIAKMGRTGIADGVHLHFELLVNGVNVNPQTYLP